MDPNNIILDNLSKSFEYIKLATIIDSCNDNNQLKEIASASANFIINSKKPCKQ